VSRSKITSEFGQPAGQVVESFEQIGFGRHGGSWGEI
jgi:hypothetical protein